MGTLAKGRSPNHGHCFVANNYYCLPNILHSVKSFKGMWAAIDQPTDGLSSTGTTKENITRFKNRSLIITSCEYHMRAEEEWQLRIMVRPIFLIKTLEWSRE